MGKLGNNKGKHPILYRRKRARMGKAERLQAWQGIDKATRREGWKAWKGEAVKAGKQAKMEAGK